MKSLQQMTSPLPERWKPFPGMTTCARAAPPVRRGQIPIIYVQERKLSLEISGFDTLLINVRLVAEFSFHVFCRIFVTSAK